MAEEKLCPHGNKINGGCLYDKQAQKLEFTNQGTYRALHCCGEPMKKKTVKAIHDCSKCGRQEAIFITIAECSCCGKEILDEETRPLKRFLCWLKNKFSKK